MMADGRCDTCKADKVCDHDRFGFENCNNYIPIGEVIESDILICSHCGAAVKIPANRYLQCVCEYCKSILREGMTPEEWDIFVLTIKERYLRAPVEELECLEKGTKRWLGILLCLLAPALLTGFASLFMG